jgi:hypothetical protein
MSSSAAFAPLSTSGKNKNLAIIGGVIAGVGAATLLGVGLFFLIRAFTKKAAASSGETLASSADAESVEESAAEAQVSQKFRPQYYGTFDPAQLSIYH